MRSLGVLVLGNTQRRRDKVTTTKSFLRCLKGGKVGDDLPPLEIENEARCVFKYALQRPKRVSFEGLVRVVV